MSNLGPRWEDDANYSPARMDAKNILRDTGTNIVAIASTKQIGLAIPTDNSGGLIKNVTYVAQYDGGFNRVQWIPVFAKHLHDSNTDAAGGKFLDILHANTADVVAIDMMHINLNDWNTTITGSGTLTYDIGTTRARAKFMTGAVSGNCTTGSLGGVSLTFTEKMMWQAKTELSHNANLVTRMGINVDKIDEAQDTARRQIGAEGCDGHGVNWVIINANGNSASLHVQATTSALLTIKSLKMISIPATETRLYENGVSVGVSTTNIPFDNTTDGLRLFRYGVKTVTASARWLYLSILKILADPGGNDLY